MEEKHGVIKLLKTLFIYIIYIIIIPIILYDMFLIIQTIINPETTPDVFGIKTFSIISGSMEPTINIDDIVIVKKVGKDDIKVNDIITFNVEEETITHRVMSIDNINNEIIYTTKGDSNKVTDIEKVEQRQIEGKYIGKIPKAGKILTLLKNKIVFGLTIIILIICFLWQRKIFANKIRRKEKRKQYERKQRLL